MTRWAAPFSGGKQEGDKKKAAQELPGKWMPDVYYWAVGSSTTVYAGAGC